MSDFDPVTWETIEAVFGPPAPEVTEHVERMKGELYDETPYDAVKIVHDALYDETVERTVPSLGEPFITAYLLEKAGVITPGEGAEDEYRSLLERKPNRQRLEEHFWEHRHTLWWIGLLYGVHASLVNFWFYEDDIPLMERNFAAESMAQIRAYRESTPE